MNATVPPVCYDGGPMNTKIVIRRIGVLSLAKIMGALDALLGLIIGAFVSLFAVVGAALLPSAGGSGGELRMLFGVGSIIVFPILYGIIGFITGLLCGALYNLLARIVGGIEIEGVETHA
jgi:hypothetical protein